MSRVTIFLWIIFELMINLFIMTSTMSIFSIYHTEMFYLAPMLFIILVSIFGNICFSYTVLLMIYFIKTILLIFLAFCKSTSHILANMAHTISQISSIPHPEHLYHPTSPTSHIPNIWHPEHPISRTFHFPNIPLP